MSKKLASYNFGLYAETFAVLYLRCKLYKILARRYKTSHGEIDIIAQRGKHVVFIEVKARKKKHDLHDVLSTRQQFRIANAANDFIAKHKKIRDHNLRFDLIIVAPGCYIRHLRNIWQS